MRRRILVVLFTLAMALVTVAAPALADKPIKDSGSISFSGLDEEASDGCGFPISTDVEASFSVLVRFPRDGGVLVTDHFKFHATHTNLDTGKSATTNGSSTSHVVVGAGTDGRDVAKITGLQGHIVVPGSGSAAQDSGQLVIETYGPNDPDPIFVSAHGVFEGMGGPLPELCDALS